MEIALPPWPKGPFPARYLAPAVLERLGASPALAQALERFARAPADPDDPYFVVVAGLRDDVLAQLEGVPLTVLAWRAGSSDDRRRGGSGVALVASTDAVDAIVAIGVASPEHGIGTAAMVRFLTTLRGMCAQLTVEGAGEDFLALALVPRSREHALRIAARARELCAPLAARFATGALADAIERDGRLELDYA